MRSRKLIVVLVVASVLSACGDDSEEGGQDVASTSEASVETTTAPDAADDVADETVAEEPTAEAESSDSLPPGSGRAELRLGDETVEFIGLTCFEGSVAAELGEDEDLVFAAVAQNGDAELAVTISDKGLSLLEVVYNPGDGPGIWHMTTTDVEGGYTFDGGLLSAADDFELVVDRAEADRVAGQLEASCG